MVHLYNRRGHSGFMDDDDNSDGWQPLVSRATDSDNEAADDEPQDDGSHGAHATLVNHVRNNHTSSYRKDDAIAYLLRYEAMIRCQDAEEMATLAHMQYCLQRLHQLGNGDAKITSSWPDMLQESVSYDCLKRALETLERDTNDKDSLPDFLTTDRQLMLVLQTLTSQESDYDKDSAEHEQLTWCEVYVCYKLCVLGMLSLQHCGSKPSILRTRIRQRTLAQLSLFQAPATRLLTNSKTSTNIMSLEQLGHDFGQPKPHKAVPRRTVVWILFMAVACFLSSSLTAAVLVFRNPTLWQSPVSTQNKDSPVNWLTMEDVEPSFQPDASSFHVPSPVFTTPPKLPVASHKPSVSSRPAVISTNFRRDITKEKSTILSSALTGGFMGVGMYPMFASSMLWIPASVTVSGVNIGLSPIILLGIGTGILTAVASALSNALSNLHA